jgi:putative transcriptional regulator
MTAIKNHVRERREALGLTQGEMAARTGVSRQAINAIETGKYDPSIGLAHALSKVFGCAIEDIFIFEDGEENEAE